jgi:prevent-host-death family protein
MTRRSDQPGTAVPAHLKAASATWSVQDAKNRFSAVIEAAQREPQTVTKHGKAAAVVVAADEFARLRELDRRHRPTFVEHLLAMPKDDHEFERLQPELRDPGF